MDKWTRKYLKLAATLKEDNTSCYSRSVACVLVSEDNRIISLGYNGSVTNAPHCDSKEHLEMLYDKIMTIDDKKKVYQKYNCVTAKEFSSKMEECKQCPRRLLDIPSGEKLYYCNCAHAERNALASANMSGTSTKNSIMYCYCGVPCWECTQQIIQAGVKKIVCIKVDHADYTPTSRYYIAQTRVELEEVDSKEI